MVNRIYWILPLLLAASLFCQCSSRQAEKAYQLIRTESDPIQRATAFEKWLSQYPRYVLFPAAGAAWLRLVYHTLDRPEEAIRFWTTQLLRDDIDRVAHLTDSLIAFYLASDRFSCVALSAMPSVPDPDERDTIDWPHPFLIRVWMHIDLPDSVRHEYLIRISSHWIQTEKPNAVRMMQYADSLTARHDHHLFAQANRQLSRVLEIGARGIDLNDALPPSPPVNDLYRMILIKMAWNAYRLERFTQALNLISQAARFGDPDICQGYIILGAAQIETGETDLGWQHLLYGLLLDPEAEIRSTEINSLYTRYFRRIEGASNPDHFLKQYRRFNPVKPRE